MPSQVVAPAAPAKRRRGRETVGDMIRSLGLVLLIVVALWFFAQPPSSDSKTIRVVDPTSDIAALRQAAPGIPVPGGLPDRWRPTSSTLDPGRLRIGYVTPADQYAEYAAAVGAQPDFLPDITGRGSPVGTLVVAGVTWQQYEDADKHTTLVRRVGADTVIVGGVRETTTPGELRTLAAAVS